MSKFTKGVGAFMSGFGESKKYNLQEVEFEITHLQSKITSTKVNHILHLLLCIPTAGFWIIAWILITISAGSERRGYEASLKDFYGMKGRLENKKADKRREQELEDTPIMDKTEKLIKLSEMLEKGLITEDEFREQKNNLI